MEVALVTKALSAVIGKQILTKAITDSSFGIYSTLSSIYFYSDDVKSILEELDIKQKIRALECLCKSLTNLEDKTGVITLCLESIHDMILEIKADLKIIHAKIAKHKKKYFNNWRSVNIKKYVKNLKKHCDILDKRYLFLVNSIKMLN